MPCSRTVPFFTSTHLPKHLAHPLSRRTNSSSQSVFSLLKPFFFPTPSYFPPVSCILIDNQISFLFLYTQICDLPNTSPLLFPSGARSITCPLLFMVQWWPAERVLQCTRSPCAGWQGRQSIKYVYVCMCVYIYMYLCLFVSIYVCVCVLMILHTYDTVT